MAKRVRRGTHRLNGPALYRALDERREFEGMSWRQVADEVGCATGGSLFTLLRDGDEVGVHSDRLLSMLAWIGAIHEIEPFVIEVPRKKEEN